MSTHIKGENGQVEMRMDVWWWSGEVEVGGLDQILFFSFESDHHDSFPCVHST